MDHKQKLTDLVNNTSAKHLGHAIKRDPELQTWILNQTQTWPNLNLTQRVRCILYDDHPVCSMSGQARIWKNLSTGFGFCGATVSCACAQKHVSEKVRESKQKITPDQQDQINQKRSQTNLTKYGVTNTGQILKAREAHTALYADTQKVQLIVDGIQQTNLDRYGVTNPMKLESVKQKGVQTTLEKYGVENINQLPERRLALGEQAKSTWARRRESNYDYLRLKHKFEHNHKVIMKTSADDYKGSVGAHYYKFECMVCDLEFEDYIYCGHVPTCKVCHPAPTPMFSSKQENQLVEWLHHLGVRMKLRDHSLINPYELDVVCVDYNLAIEYCGLYWHAERSNQRGIEYHRRKMLMCAKKGIRLITIFSDEWQFKHEIVKQKLAHVLGKSDHAIGARHCEVEQIPGDQAKLFLEQNHLQGWAPNARVYLGLVHKGSLQAVMSFCELRTFTNNKPEPGSWEMLRYATCTHVQGGASKLLKSFERMHDPKRLISFADARWSQGHMYHKLGFELLHTSDPGYWYTRDYLTREHRANHTKKRLVSQGHDASLTEWEIQQQRGYDRIWDCGQYKFEKIYL
jgi:hypothetical protein